MESVIELSQKRCPDFPRLSYLLQFIRLNNKVFQDHLRDIVPPVCPALPRALLLLRHSGTTLHGGIQQAAPKQLTPLDVKEEQLYYKLLLGNPASHPNPKSDPVSHPVLKGDLVPHCPTG